MFNSSNEWWQMVVVVLGEGSIVDLRGVFLGESDMRDLKTTLFIY